MAGVDVVGDHLGGVGEVADGAGHGAGEEERRRYCCDQGNQCHQEHLVAVLCGDLVDLAGARGEQEDAVHGLHALDRYGHGDDLFEILRQQQHGRGSAAGHGDAHLGVVGAKSAVDLAINGQLLVEEPARHPGPEILGLDAAVAVLRIAPGVLLGLEDGAAMQELVAVDDQCAVAGIDARACVGRLDQPAQDGRNPLGPDRQFQRCEAVVAERDTGVRRFGQLGRIECQAFGFDLGVAGDGGGDDLALDAQGFALGVDQPASRTRHIENADAEDEEADEVRQKDAAQERACDEPGNRLIAPPPADRRPHTGARFGRADLNRCVGSLSAECHGSSSECQRPYS